MLSIYRLNVTTCSLKWLNDNWLSWKDEFLHAVFLEVTLVVFILHLGLAAFRLMLALKHKSIEQISLDPTKSLSGLGSTLLVASVSLVRLLRIILTAWESIRWQAISAINSFASRALDRFDCDSVAKHASEHVYDCS